MLPSTVSPAPCYDKLSLFTSHCMKWWVDGGIRRCWPALKHDSDSDEIGSSDTGEEKLAIQESYEHLVLMFQLIF